MILNLFHSNKNIKNHKNIFYKPNLLTHLIFFISSVFLHPGQTKKTKKRFSNRCILIRSFSRTDHQCNIWSDFDAHHVKFCAMINNVVSVRLENSKNLKNGALQMTVVYSGMYLLKRL